jgi:hypothetical protein
MRSRRDPGGKYTAIETGDAVEYVRPGFVNNGMGCVLLRQPIPPIQLSDATFGSEQCGGDK